MLLGAAHGDEIPYLYNLTMFDYSSFSMEKLSNSLICLKWYFWSLKLWNPCNFWSFSKKSLMGKELKSESKSYKLMEQMTEMWINFAKTG